MNRHEIKDRLRAVKKSTWIYWGCMVFFVLLALGLGIMAIYLCGYDLGSWLKQFYPWLVLGLAVAIIIVSSILLYKYKKRR